MYTILLTAAIQPFEVASALQFGARGIVLKASPPKILLKKSRAVCDHELWIGSEITSTCTRSPQRAVITSPLTARQTEIISAIRDGKSNRGRSSRLELSVLTGKQDLGSE